MFKRYIGLPILCFALLTVKQFIFNDTIQWIDNIGISIFLYFGYLFLEWAKIPHRSRKDVENEE